MRGIHNLIENVIVGIRNAAERNSIVDCGLELELAKSLTLKIGQPVLRCSAYLDLVLEEYLAKASQQERELLVTRAQSLYIPLMSKLRSQANDLTVAHTSANIFHLILLNGLSLIAEALHQSNFEWCFCEADHIHNAGRYAVTQDQVEWLGYISEEVPLYLQRLQECIDNRLYNEIAASYRSLWVQLKNWQE